MIKQVIQYLDASVCAETALVIFACVFVAVTIRTLLMSQKQSSLKNISNQVQEELLLNATSNLCYSFIRRSILNFF